MNSTWVNTAKVGRASGPLRNALTAEAAIVGSGLAGVTAAYLLAKAGKDVVLITDKTIADSTCAYKAAFITENIDTSLMDLEKMFGREKARMVWRSGSDAIKHIEATVKEEKIECEFMRCPSYTYASKEAEWKTLQAETKRAKALGFRANARRDDCLLFKNEGYMELPNQAKFHALKYLVGLRRAAKSYGARIFDNSEAKKIEREGDQYIVRTQNGSVTARNLFIATYYPFNSPIQLFAHTGRYFTYVIESSIPRGRLPEAIYQDSKNPYHYFRVDRMKTHDRLVVGGEDHRREIPMDQRKNFKFLLNFMRDLLSDEKLVIKTKWKWGVIEPTDGLPLIGLLKVGDAQFVATGFSGTGMTMSRVAAEMFADFVLGRKNKWSQLYDPRRIPTPRQLATKGADYTGELFGGAVKNIIQKPRA